MIKIENVITPSPVEWKMAIMGARNAMNSWDRYDSNICYCGEDAKCSCCEDNHTGRCCNGFVMGNNDHDLLTRLAKNGPVHATYRRMLDVYLDITAPLYFWKEMDRYSVGKSQISCSTMHKIHDKEFTLEDFSCEHLYDTSKTILEDTINHLNDMRSAYNWDNTDAKKEYWWQMIQLLPSSYNQKRTVKLNYEVLANIYKWRKNHKLDEWCLHETPIEHSERNKDFASGAWGFCDWIESLPYSELITAEKEAPSKLVAKLEVPIYICKCKDCERFIPLDQVENDEEYKHTHNARNASRIGFDGLCTNVDKWCYSDDYCSGALRKEEENEQDN